MYFTSSAGDVTLAWYSVNKPDLLLYFHFSPKSKENSAMFVFVKQGYDTHMTKNCLRYISWIKYLHYEHNQNFHP